MSTPGFLDEESLETMTPFELLCVKEAAEIILAADDADPMFIEVATLQLGLVLLELIRRGRCAICGQRHSEVDCPRYEEKHG